MGDLTTATLADLGVTPEMVEVAVEVLSDPEISDLRGQGRINDRGLVELVLITAMAHESAGPTRSEP